MNGINAGKECKIFENPYSIILLVNTKTTVYYNVYPTDVYL